MKNQRLKKNVLKWIFGSALGVSPAIAADNKMTLGLVGAATVQEPSFSKDNAGVPVDGKWGWGGGVSAEFVLQDALGLEADLLYLGHKFTRSTADFFGTEVASTVTSGYLHLPVLLRFQAWPYLSLGGGLYYSRVINSWTVSAEGFDDVSANYNKNDWGMVLALGTGIPVGETLALGLDLRYARSLQDTAQETDEVLKFAEFQVLVGVKTVF